jgi:hypothetical protein
MNVEHVLMLLYHIPGEATYELSMTDGDGELTVYAQALLARLPAQYGPHATCALWRSIASDRLGLYREAQMRIRDLELELAFRGADIVQEAAGIVRDSKGREVNG